MGKLKLVWSTDACFMSAHIREINKEFHNERLTKDLARSTKVLKVTTCVYVCLFIYLFEWNVEEKQQLAQHHDRIGSSGSSCEEAAVFGIVMKN